MREAFMDEQDQSFYPTELDEEGRRPIDQLRRLLREGKCREDEAGQIEYPSWT